MSRALRIARRLFFGVCALALFAALAGYLYARRSWPRESGTLRLQGLASEVEILRDAYGVPHIFAGSERDLFFGQGFVHAQDRLWQMHLARALARGELSALFGEAALESDKTVRTLGVARAARDALARLDQATRDAVQAYCDGVNAFLDGDGRSLPVEFAILGATPEHWQPVDVMLVAENISLAMSLNYYYEVMRVRLAAKLGPRAAELLPPYPKDAPVTIPAEKHGSLLPNLLPALRGRPGGSNSWAVHGSRTASGKPLLANDTHLALPLPSIWYENGLYAGRYAVEGFSFPGAPFVAIGHNRHIAWGITNMCSDVQDLYYEHVDATHYDYQGQKLPLVIETEQIPVKGKPPVELRIVKTRHGPIVNEALAAAGTKELPPVSLRWAAREGGTLFNALGALDRAQSWREFREALRGWPSPSLNFVYADIDGNIGYQSTGLIPLRAPGHTGQVPVEGWTGQNEWLGFIPFDELPSVENPASGYVVSANNKVIGDDYPHHLADDWGDPYRAQRITDVLAKNTKVTIDDMRNLQADDYSLPAKSLLPYLKSLSPTDELQKRALKLLDGWDLRFTTESAAATIYYAWYSSLLDEVIADELGPELLKDFRPLAYTNTPLFVRMMANPDNPWFDDVRTPARESRDEISARAFAQGIDSLRKEIGGDPAQWKWGKLHTMSFPHQPFGESGIAPLEWIFNSHKVAAAGEPYAVNATFQDPGVSFAVTSGPSQRFIADLSALGQSRAATPIGQSGLLFHPHREDQVDLWSAVQHHPMPFERGPVAAAARAVLVLAPVQSQANARNP